jgi:hypothetical protein
MKSATEIMQEIIFSAVIDSLAALKTASKGMPNTLLRDINAIHANATFADLPKDVQASIQTSVRAAFNRLLKEGYNVSSGQPAPQRPQSPRPDRPTGPRGTPGTNRRPPRQGERPNRGPSNRGGPGGGPRPGGGAPKKPR